MNDMTTKVQQRAAVFWTGGKDSALALTRVREAGLPVAALVTFAPEDARFRAHPLPVLAAQALSLGIVHRVVTLRLPYERAYIEAFEGLLAKGFTHLVTGDIDLVEGLPNWVRQCASGLPLEVVTPLWNEDRESLLVELERRRFRVVFSCVRPPVPALLCGRELDDDAKRLLRECGADLCGENGEYHTLVLDAPGFRWSLSLDATPVTGEDQLTTLDVRGVRTCPPTPAPTPP
jgi:uncharacterized protein (TIGR00290 family)